MVGRVGLSHMVALALAPVLLAGCFSSSIRVVQKVPVDHTRDRIYVIVYEGPITSYYSNHLAGAVIEALGAHTGARKGTVLTGLEFDTTWLEKDMDAFGAEVVLTVRPLGTRTDRYGNLVGLIYGATLHDRSSNQDVWAAKMEVYGALEWGIKEAAEKIVAALANDHMIAGPVVSAGPGPAPPSGQTGQTGQTSPW
jgi:hypothetical protein